MTHPPRFHLEHALAAWRRSLEHNRAFSVDDVAELEQHLRDQVAGLMAAGLPAEDAFQRSLGEMGDFTTAEIEYRKVYWGKLRRRRQIPDEIRWRLSLLRNFITVAWRNIQRHKGYSSINLFGLAIGLACCLLIYMYVRDELAYDRLHLAAETTYRVNWDFSWNGSEGVGPGTPPPLAAAFTRELSEVTSATRLYAVPRMVVRREDAFFNEDRIRGVDANFFSFFDFRLLEGSPATVLEAPNSIVLTETTARKYFGDEPALGKELIVGTEKQVFGRTYQPVFHVTGIVADSPQNSHIQFDMLTSMASHPEVAFFDWSWVWMQMATYVRLEKGTLREALVPRVRELVGRHAPGAFERIGFSYEDLLAGGGRWDFTFQPLMDVYLGSVAIGNRLGPIGNRTYVLLFSAIAVLVLLVACINYTNLATAQSAVRAREVGVRKVMGAPRRSLIGQFMAESMVLSVLALPLALAIMALILGPFNQLSGKSLSFSPSFEFIALLLGLLVCVGLGAGAYPGIYLSAFRPVHTLKGAAGPGRRKRRLRDGLVVGQFVATIVLIACTLGVREQMNFVREADLGFDRGGILVISNENHPLGDQAEAFKEQVKRQAGVLQASVSTGVPPEFGFQDYYKVEGRGDEQLQLISYMVDMEFASTLGLEIVEGRGFSEDRPTDAESVILNETAVRAFGLEDPVGKTISYTGAGDYQIIGVLKDFHFMALRTPIVPFALFHEASASYDITDSYVLVRLARADAQATVERLAELWRTFAPETPFEYNFLDERFDAQYRDDQRLGDLFTIFALITICIACLGLFGLAAFAAEQRTKEIGVRKVLGADVPGLVVLLARDFARLVLIAFVLAVPVAYFSLQRWLEDYSYRVSAGPGIFLLAGGLALLIALLTVGYQSIKAALADPVESLRYE